MSTKELYFPDALTIGLGPGEAIEVRAGEVVPVPGELVATLLKRRGVAEAGPGHSEARRVSVAEARLRIPTHVQARLSPPLDDDRLLFEADKKQAAEKAREYLRSGRREAPKTAA
jgi:hypothetical protein